MENNPLLDILKDVYNKGEKEGAQLQDLMKDIEQNLRVLLQT